METMQALATAPMQPAALTSATPRSSRRRRQAIRSLERLTEVETLLTNLSANDEMRALLQARGYDTSRLAEGTALRDTLAEAFLMRQQMLGALREAYAVLNNAMRTARGEYVEFRASARVLFASQADRTRLDLDAPIPNDMNAFLGLARLVYQTALETPVLAAALEGYGYSAERLNGMLAHVAAAANALHAIGAASTAAQQATMQRVEASRALENWVHRLLTAARLATRAPGPANAAGLRDFGIRIVDGGWRIVNRDLSTAARER